MKICFVAFSVILIAAIGVVAQTDIRKVDFKNFTYSAYCIGNRPQNIKVKDGEYSSEKQEDGWVDRFSFTVFATAFGDVNGDGSDDAITLTSCNTGGTGNFSEGMVYSMKAGKPAVIARIPGGDRADGGLRSARVEKGLLVVESNEEGPEGGLCCPQFIITRKYKVVAGKLVQQGKPLKESIDRTERVRFDPGTSSATFTAYVPGSESKKFVVGARAGQTLTVTVNGDQAGVRLLSPAEHNEDKKSFRALLPKNGDYTFEVTNDSATEDEFTITVTIK